MPTRRMISYAMWEDDFFTSLVLFDRLVWIGLITACADDQGRLQDSAALSRSKIFPLDDVAINDIENALCRFKVAGKIERYIAGSKKAIQIITWWKHQTPMWASASSLPAPAGWVDRERYHTTGNKIKLLNWDLQGGYVEGYIAHNVDTSLPRDGEGEGDVKGEGEGEGSAPDSFDLMQHLVERLTGYPTNQRDIQAINDLVRNNVTEDDLKTGLAFLDGKKRVMGAADLAPSAIVSHGKRIQAENKADTGISGIHFDNVRHADG